VGHPNNINSTYTFSMSSISWKPYIHFLKKGQKFPSRDKIINPSPRLPNWPFEKVL
jgi:hypothetical protein